MRPIPPAIILWLALSALPLAGRAAAQVDGDPAPGSTAARNAAGELPPVEQPPELSASRRQRLGRAIKKLRNSNPLPRATAEEQVIAFGRGALPALIEAANTRHAGMQDGLQHCLVTLVDLRDRLLVAEALESEHLVLRRFAAQAAGKLGTPSLLERLPPLLDDEDEEVRTRAALSLTGNGLETALGVLVDITIAAEAPAADASGSRRSRGAPGDSRRDRWSNEIAAALLQLRGAGPHQALLERLVIDEELDRDDPRASAAIRLTTVQLLATIGDEAAVRGLARALQDPHNIVQQDAINALRALVEHKPPFQGATFQQIKELERLRTLMSSWPGFDDGQDH